jgi:hypothetical protein
MSAPANATQATTLRSWLAKLVIGASVVVALADSPPRTWIANEEWNQHVALDETNERRFLLSIELAGELYADARNGSVSIWASVDRAASDLTLAGRTLPPDEEPEGAGLLQDARADAGPGGAAPDAARTWPDMTGWELRRPSAGAAAQVGIGFGLACTDRERHVPGELRPETCVERFELSLARDSERTLSGELAVEVTVVGETQRQPPGTIQIRLQELAP